MTRTTAHPTADAAGVPGYSGFVASIVPGSLYVAERPGGGGRSHRATRRAHDLAALRDAGGVRTVVSCMRSRHGLIDYSRDGFGVRWHPLATVEQARRELPRMADDVALTLSRDPGAVVVHVDRVGEWTTAVAASLLVRLGIADTPAAALAQAEGMGLPVGDLSREVMGVTP